MLSNKLLGVRRESDEERSRKDFSELNSELFYPFPSSAGIERDFLLRDWSYQNWATVSGWLHIRNDKVDKVANICVGAALKLLRSEKPGAG